MKQVYNRRCLHRGDILTWYNKNKFPVPRAICHTVISSLLTRENCSRPCQTDSPSLLLILPVFIDSCSRSDSLFCPIQAQTGLDMHFHLVLLKCCCSNSGLHRSHNLVQPPLFLGQSLSLISFITFCYLFWAVRNIFPAKTAKTLLVALIIFTLRQPVIKLTLNTDLKKRNLLNYF